MMDARTFDKLKRPSRHLAEGPTLAPHRSYYHTMGGLIAHIDIITIDEVDDTSEHEVSKEELARRRENWKLPANPYQSEGLGKFVDQVGPARFGAVAYAGGIAQVGCYADI